MDDANCGLTDTTCKVLESTATILQGFADGISGFGWFAISSAFSGGAGTISTDEWEIAAGMTSKWGMVVLVVVAAVTLLKMAQALIAGNPQEAASAFVMGVLAWPLTMLCVWMAIQTTDATDRLSIGILTSGDESGFAVIGSTYDALSPVVEGMMAQMPFESGDEAFKLLVQAFLTCLLAAAALLAQLALSFMLAFRNFAMLVLIGFAPVAFMALPVKSTRAWARKWGEVTIALIMAKPLAAGMLVMAQELFVNAEGFWQWLIGIVAMVMAAFAPVVTMRMLAFVGGDTAAAAGTHGTSIVNNTGAGAARGVKSLIGR